MIPRRSREQFQQAPGFAQCNAVLLLLRFENQVFRSRLADVQDLVPDYSGTGKAAPRGQIDFPGPAVINNPHSATVQCVTEMRGMIVAFVPHAGPESASEDSLVRIFVQSLADWRTVPPRGQRVGQLGGCRARGT